MSRSSILLLLGLVQKWCHDVYFSKYLIRHFIITFGLLLTGINPNTCSSLRQGKSYENGATSLDELCHVVVTAQLHFPFYRLCEMITWWKSRDKSLSPIHFVKIWLSNFLGKEFLVKMLKKNFYKITLSKSIPIQRSKQTIFSGKKSFVTTRPIPYLHLTSSVLPGIHWNYFRSSDEQNGCDYNICTKNSTSESVYPSKLNFQRKIYTFTEGCQFVNSKTCLRTLWWGLFPAKKSVADTYIANSFTTEGLIERSRVIRGLPNGKKKIQMPKNQTQYWLAWTFSPETETCYFVPRTVICYRHFDTDFIFSTKLCFKIYTSIKHSKLKLKEI